MDVEVCETVMAWSFIRSLIFIVIRTMILKNIQVLQQEVIMLRKTKVLLNLFFPTYTFYFAPLQEWVASFLWETRVLLVVLTSTLVNVRIFNFCLLYKYLSYLGWDYSYCYCTLICALTLHLCNMRTSRAKPSHL